MIKNKMTIYKCKDNYYRENEVCLPYDTEKCISIKEGDCLECQEGMWISNRQCHSNNITYCKKQWKDKCLECYSPYVLNQTTNECDSCQFGYNYETFSKTCQQNKNKRSE